MLVPMATMWDPLALVPRMPLTFLLSNNQPFFQFFDKEMRELGSRRRRLPRDETRRAFQPRLMGDWGRLHWGTVPRLLEMHRSQGTPLQPRAACRLRSLVLQRVPQPVQGGWRWAKPWPLACNNVPGCCSTTEWPAAHGRSSGNGRLGQRNEDDSAGESSSCSTGCTAGECFLQCFGHRNGGRGCRGSSPARPHVLALARS